MASIIGRTIRSYIQPLTQRSQFISRTELLQAQPRLLFSSTTGDETLDKEKIEKLVKNNKVVVFMKGIPDAPKCGFSNAVVQILRMHAVKYDSHDVLENDAIRQGIKDFTNWPTIPQVFIAGEFVGGCDILLQMHQNGELIDELKKVGITSALLNKVDEDKSNGTEQKKE